MSSSARSVILLWCHCSAKARNEGSRLKCWEYIGYFYSLQIIHNGKRIEQMGFDKFLGVKRTSLKEFLEHNPDV
jgi:hypothetical protein